VTDPKHLFRNQSQGVVGYTYYDEDNKKKGGAVQPGDSVWLAKKDCVATALAPKDPADNPLDNGKLVREGSEDDPGTSRPIGIPGEKVAPSSDPEPAPASEETSDEPPEDPASQQPSAEQLAQEQAAKEKQDREARAKEKIAAAEAAEKRNEEAAANAVKGKGAADLRPEPVKPAKEQKAAAEAPAAKGAEETATAKETQGASGEGERSSTEAVATPDAQA